MMGNILYYRVFHTLLLNRICLSMIHHHFAKGTAKTHLSTSLIVVDFHLGLSLLSAQWHGRWLLCYSPGDKPLSLRGFRDLWL
jgi:hypothetical protein